MIAIVVEANEVGNQHCVKKGMEAYTCVQTMPKRRDKGEHVRVFTKDAD